jgi:hypothetical protein
MSDRLDLVIEEVDLLIAEATWTNARGPHFLVLHRWQKPGTDCLAGEEIAAVRFMSFGREFDLELPVGPLLVFDFVARHRWLPLNGSQIAAGLNRDPFCSQHGANAPTSRKQTRKFNHGVVKVYIERIREAMAVAFREAGVSLDPFLILISAPAGYRLKATVDWLHVADHRVNRYYRP